MRRLVGILILAFPGLFLAPQDRTVFPAGPIADLVKTLPDTTAELPFTWPAWDDRSAAGWGGELPWRRWVEALRAESGTRGPDPARRLELALLARLQGRDADAWRHLLAARANPALVAAALPAFLPGVPVEYLAHPDDMPAGVLLRPALPPAVHDPKGSLRQLAGRVMEHRFVRVGGTLFTLRILIEGDGVQVDAIHREGPEVTVRIAPPVPPGVEIGALYADWEKIEGELEVAELTLSAEAPRHTIWGRFLPRSERWPAPRPSGDLPLPLRDALVVVVPAERLSEPVFQRFAEALAELFELPCELRPPGPLAGDPTLEPVAIHLDTGPRTDRKLVALMALV
ncbi:MAG: hypothetical protein JRG96_21415, partial [Deltaproteobacteria bacterium]|nr:hypothetical protein [Deltaproteobacteria bacterium]